MTNTKPDTPEKKLPALIANVVNERDGKTYWNRRGAASSCSDALRR